MKFYIVMIFEISSGEQAFFPLHFSITFITAGIFFTIIYVISKIHAAGNQRTEPITVGDFNTANAVSIIGLVITLIGALITNFINVPVLDYESLPTQQVNDTVVKHNVRIKNYGLVPAKNVVLTMQAKNLTFKSFATEPSLLSTNVKWETNSYNNTGNGIVQIDSIPIRSITNVSSLIDVSKLKDNHTKLTIQVRSDQTIANRGALAIVVYYIALAAVYMILSGLMWLGIIPRRGLSVFLIMLPLIAVLLSLTPYMSDVYRT
jgi:hypothetical protein